jgi:hypothetical protein
VKKHLSGLAIFCACACLGGCATDTKISKTATFQWASPTKRVVLIQPDVQLMELTAGGVTEPRADWTQTAQGFIAKDVAAHFSGTGAEVVHADDLKDPHDVQLVKLHGVVGQSILRHLYASVLKLPNKGDALDWTLGPGTNDMRQRYGADYALFIFVRDSYASAGRVAFIIGAALVGVSVPGGQQVGFASLVDLRTGNIVWFNRLLSGTGDLRTEQPAQKTVDNLIKALPL